MAIFNCNIKNFNRRSGLSNICAAAAYRSGEALRSSDDELVKYPHRRRADIEHAAMLNNPYDSRQELWAAVERKDNRKNSNLAREIEIALPRELDKQQRRELSMDIGKKLVDRYGVAVDLSIHKERQGNGNHHAHILMTTRRVENKGLGKKTRELDQKKTGAEEFKHIRNEIYAATVNKHLERAGSAERIGGERTGSELKQVHHGHNKAKKDFNKQIKAAIESGNELKKEIAENERRQINELEKGVAVEDRRERQIASEAGKETARERRLGEKIKRLGERVKKRVDEIGERIMGRVKKGVGEIHRKINAAIERSGKAKQGDGRLDGLRKDHLKETLEKIRGQLGQRPNERERGN